MKKLFTLKKWLTLQEAARHLTIVFGEDVSEADVLRLALDGHLKLSVNFVNQAKARGGKVVPIEEAEFYESVLFSNISILEEHKGKPIQVMRGINLDDERVLNLDNDVVTLDGVHDLVMLGSERLYVEHEYQMLTNGPSVELTCMDGAFVYGDGDVMYQLQKKLDQNGFHRDSTALRRELKAQIQADDPESPNTRVILGKYLEKLQTLEDEEAQRRKAGQESDNYYPSPDLPEGSVLVVRRDALIEFEQSINVDTAPVDKPLTATERNTLLTIIAALCDFSAIDLKERGTAGRIASYTEEIGAPVTDDTVRKVLAKIPDAVERRMK